MDTPRRREYNKWLRIVAKDIPGDILSVGGRSDLDGERGLYRSYFKSKKSYTTSDVFPGADLLIDILDMSSVPEGRYDCIICNNVLEHVFDTKKAIAEMTRSLKKGGSLILCVPFRQAYHRCPNDYWRFTRDSLNELLKNDYEIKDIQGILEEERYFPDSYAVLAIKK